MAYAARVLLDSQSPAGVRLTTLEVTFPRFVLAEFNTHRSFCLDGDTRLYFDLPVSRKKNRRPRRFTMTIAELFEKWHHGAAPRKNRFRSVTAANIVPDLAYTARELASLTGYAHHTGVDLLTRRAGIPRIVSADAPYRVRGRDFLDWFETEGLNRQPMRNRLASMNLRSCNENTGEIYHTHVRDVTYSGEQPVFRVTLKNGQTIVASKNHRFLTASGWQRLEEAVGLEVSRSGIAIWTRAAEFAVNGILAYKDPKWLAGMRDVGLSAAMIARHCGVTVDQVKYQMRRHGLRSTNPQLVWELAHGEDPWNKGRRYCNLTTRGRPSRAQVRKGPESHLWRGGTTPERTRISVWTGQQAFRIHRANGFRCVLCDSKRTLHTHHIDPVAHNKTRAYDVTNLTSLCKECHARLHQRGLELRLLDHVEAGRPFRSFWRLIGDTRLRRPFIAKRKRATVRHFVALKSIEYLGVRPTYDLEVQGPFHNFVADGFIVHNSRNSASSRAIPTAKLLQRVEDDPAMPLEWGRNKPGMSASEVLSERHAEAAKQIWLRARDQAVAHARELVALDVHKQELNRILEPFLWHTVIVSATEWSNFFELRCSPNAQPEIRAAALAMRDAITSSRPLRVDYGEWHAPLVQPDEQALDREVRKCVSAARCARVSYLTHEGTREIEKDLALCERLRHDRHLSPFEHVAEPAHDTDFHANFRGWVQMRREIENSIAPSSALG